LKRLHGATLGRGHGVVKVHRGEAQTGEGAGGGPGLIEISLTQANGSLLQTFSLHLRAAPLREVWFSTAKSLMATNGTGHAQRISAGDLLSNRGRVVRGNQDLVGRLGVMPPVPDLGLDAVQVGCRGEILFSIP